jgi:hypothetical protein
LELERNFVMVSKASILGLIAALVVVLIAVAVAD